MFAVSSAKHSYVRLTPIYNKLIYFHCFLSWQTNTSKEDPKQLVAAQKEDSGCKVRRTFCSFLGPNLVGVYTFWRLIILKTKSRSLIAEFCLLSQGNVCPGKPTKIKPQSCIDHLRNGAKRLGYYKIYDAAGNGFTVYCDMETEPGAAWTLVVSWSLKNKDFPSFRYVCSLHFPPNKNETIRGKEGRDHMTIWIAECSKYKVCSNLNSEYA